MGGFVTSGMGQNLVTVGFGGTTDIIIITPPEVSKAGGSIHHKRTVRGITIVHSHPLKILKVRRIDTNSRLKIFRMMNEQWTAPMEFLQNVDRALSEPLEFAIFIIKNMDGVITFKSRVVKKIANPIEIKLSKYVKKISKMLEIVEKRVIKRGTDTEILNTKDLLEATEASDLIDLLKDMEDAEDE